VKEVYINDNLVDLDEKDNPIALTYAVNNLAELKDRQAYSTNNFKLPLSQKNLSACGLPNSASFIGLQPYRKNTAKIVQNGIEILTNGIAIINQTQQAIEVQILSGIIGFFDLIDGKYISDIDLSDYEHDWTLATVIASQTNTEGFTYPVIDYGALPLDSKDVNVKQLRPATFRKTLIERIISEAGYTFEGVVTSDERYQKSLLAFSNDKFEHGKSFIDAANTISASARNNISQELQNDFRDFIIEFQDDAGTDPGSNWSGTEYTAPDIIRVQASFAYDLLIRDQFKGGSTPSISMQIEAFKSGIWVIVAQNIHLAQGEFVNYTYEDQKLEVNVDLLAGEKIRITAHSEPATQRVFGRVLLGASVSIQYLPQDVVFGQSVQLEATLPKITQKDFFKDFLQMFGLIVIPDNYNKHIKLINMQEIYENRPRAVDWTDRFVDQIPQVDYSFGEYGVNNYGNFKKDDNVIQDTGRGTLVLDNQTLDQDVDLFRSVFAASNGTIKLQGIPVTQITKIEDDSLEFKKKTEPRILMDLKQNTPLVFTDEITDTEVLTISLPYFQRLGFPGLGYDELFTENYPEIKRMLFRPFVMTRPALLKESDVANIDWTLPIYDRLTAAYYYRNAINSYIEGEICFVSLVKMV
jgi:hypothetical protein